MSRTRGWTMVAGLGLAVVAAGCGLEWEEDRTRAAVSESAPSDRDAGGATARPDGGVAPAALVSRVDSPDTVVDSPPTEVAASSSPAEYVTYEDAERVFRAGAYEEAANLFEAYAARRPDNPLGHYMLGISAWRAGDHLRAELALRRTLEAAPDHERGQLNLARVMLEQRKASDALDVVDRLVEQNPGLGEAWRVLGNAWSDLGMAAAAADAYRKAIALDHEDAWTMNNLGLLKIRHGRYAEALPALARATELRPDVAVFQNNLGVALERLGYVEAAAEAYRSALAVDPTHQRARASLERVESLEPGLDLPPLELANLAAAFADEVASWPGPGANGDGGDLETTLLRIGEGC